MRALITTALLGITTIVAPIAGAQQRAAAVATVAPGMSRAQVVAALGEPATARTASEYSYLFYHNECGKRCGVNDLVVIRHDSVVDAIFRSPSRRYTGKSSSPAPISAADAARKRPGAANSMPVPARAAAAGSTAPTASSDTTKPRRMRPGPATDTRPSIPLNPPAVKPAPSSPSTRIP